MGAPGDINASKPSLGKVSFPLVLQYAEEVSLLQNRTASIHRTHSSFSNF